MYKITNQLSKYCNLSIASLHRAVGLQTNYKVTGYKEQEELDIYTTGCLSCPYYKQKELFQDFPDQEPYKQAEAACASCEKKKYLTRYIEEVTYVNESNRYGKAERLPATSLRLYLLCHFMAPDANGIIRHASLDWMATSLGVTRQTIIRSLAKLTAYGYVSTCNTGHAVYLHICISRYRDMYLPAQEGGRGFVVMTDSLFDKLIHIDNITALRITIKNYLELERMNTPTQAENTIDKDFTEIRRYLPDYCKPNIIRKALEKTKSIFKLIPTGHGYLFQIEDRFNGKQLKKKQLEYNKETIMKEIAAINDYSLSGQASDQPTPEHLLGYTGSLTPLAIPEEQVSAITVISLQYGLIAVLKAISDMHLEICQGTEIYNPGGYIRQNCRKQLKQHGLSLSIA